MRIEPFEMERWQSTWEHRVDINLSESGVHPLTVGGLLELPGELPAPAPEDLLRIPLGYTQGNGAPELRDRIALIYPGAEIDNILVTHGSSEANFLAATELLEPGDRIAFMIPNYMQMRGLGAAWCGDVADFALREDSGWEADLGALDASVTERTKLIVVTNPNNPTGKALGEPFIDGVVEIASRAGAWILADEVYQGAELDGIDTPSFWEKYDKLIVTSGLSKAYGLPGLRIGWAACPDKKKIETLWSYHDYTTICSAGASEALATAALDPVRRLGVLERTRGILRENLPVIRAWAEERRERFTFRQPDAGAIFWIRYRGDAPSAEIAERLRVEESTLIVPGVHFGMEGYIRIGYGVEKKALEEGLMRVAKVMDGM